MSAPLLVAICDLGFIGGAFFHPDPGLGFPPGTPTPFPHRRFGKPGDQRDDGFDAEVRYDGFHTPDRVSRTRSSSCGRATAADTVGRQEHVDGGVSQFIELRGAG